MWNRQREAQEARERLALIADESATLDRLPGSPVDADAKTAEAELLAKADLIDP
jgi:hypothetical protein